MIIRRLLSVSLAALLALQCTTTTISVEEIVTLWSFILAANFILSRDARLPLLLFFSLTLYASTAYFAYEYGNQKFDPWPSYSLIIDATIDSLFFTIVAFIATEALFGLESIGRAVLSSARRIRERLAGVGSTPLDNVLFTGTLILASLDWIAVARIGIVDVLTADRREFADHLLLGSNHNIQVVAMAATIYSAIRARKSNRKAWIIVSLILLWLPFALVGSRKELVTVGAIIFVLLVSVVSWKVKSLAALTTAALFVFPAIKSGNMYSSLHEFILPQHMQFAVRMGLVPENLGGSFWEKSQFLLPSALRISEVQDNGSAFLSLGLLNVGVGSSPFAEADLVKFFNNPSITFVLLFISTLIILKICSNKLPEVTIVSFGLLLVYGRSDFWTFAFFAVYISIILHFFIKWRNGILRPQRIAVT